MENVDRIIQLYDQDISQKEFKTFTKDANFTCKKSFVLNIQETSHF